MQQRATLSRWTDRTLLRMRAQHGRVNRSFCSEQLHFRFPNTSILARFAPNLVHILIFDRIKCLLIYGWNNSQQCGYTCIHMLHGPISIAETCFLVTMSMPSIIWLRKVSRTDLVDRRAPWQSPNCWGCLVHLFFGNCTAFDVCIWKGLSHS